MPRIEPEPTDRADSNPLNCSGPELEERLRRMVWFTVQEVHEFDEEWWRSVLKSVRAHEQARTKQYRRLVEVLESHIPGISGRIIESILLTPLDHLQEWVVLVVCHEFFDQQIITHDSFEDWDRVWQMANDFYSQVLSYITAHPRELDVTRLEDAWDRLVKAACYS